MALRWAHTAGSICKGNINIFFCYDIVNMTNAVRVDFFYTNSRYINELHNPIRILWDFKKREVVKLILIRHGQYQCPEALFGMGK